MSIIVAARQIMPLDIWRGGHTYSGGLREWLSSNEYSVSQTPTKSKTELQLFSIDSYYAAQATDMLRLSTASFQSVKSIRPVPGKSESLAWIAISNYYAAYFAANALMRLFGFFCTNLYAQQAVSISETSQLYGNAPAPDKKRLVAGTYRGWLEAGSYPAVHLTTLEGVKGGVHIQFWASFQIFLQWLSEQVKLCSLPKPDIKNALIELDNIKSGLCFQKANNGSWLSEIRNGVNYRFEHGAWHPFSTCEVDHIALNALALRGLRERVLPCAVNESVPDLYRSGRLSASIVSWLCLSLLEVKEISSKRKAKQLDAGPLALL